MGNENFEIVFGMGRAGLKKITPKIQYVVLFDTFHFSTAVDIALSRGAVVFPSGSNDRNEMPANWISPSSLQRAHFGERINVLPSPSTALAKEAFRLLKKNGHENSAVISACLRNAAAVCEWLSRRSGPVLLLVASSYEPKLNEDCFEDILSAGAVAAGLSGSKSPETMAAHATFVASINSGILEGLTKSKNGIQLMNAGKERDIQLAAELDVSDSVPVLDEFGAFANF